MLGEKKVKKSSARNSRAELGYVWHLPVRQHSTFEASAEILEKNRESLRVNSKSSLRAWIASIDTEHL